MPRSPLQSPSRFFGRPGERVGLKSKTEIPKYPKRIQGYKKNIKLPLQGDFQHIYFNPGRYPVLK